MSASRRAQLQALCGVRSGPLIDRVEAYLAAVDLWSRRGNAKAVKNAGTGVVAVCCYLAAESLELHVPDRSSAIRASGLTPQQFAIAEKDFRMAVQSVSQPVPSVASNAGSVSSEAATTAFAASLRGGLGAPNRPTTSSPLATSQRAKSSEAPSSKSKEALLAKAQAIQAGSVFDQTMRSDRPSSPHSSKGKTRQIDEAGHSSSIATTDRETSASHPALSRQDGGYAVLSPEVPTSRKRKRMSRLIVGLSGPSAIPKGDDNDKRLEEAERRNQIRQRKATIEKLLEKGTSWKYLGSPRDFMISIRPRNS